MDQIDQLICIDPHCTLDRQITHITSLVKHSEQGHIIHKVQEFITLYQNGQVEQQSKLYTHLKHIANSIDLQIKHMIIDLNNFRNAALQSIKQRITFIPEPSDSQQISQDKLLEMIKSYINQDNDLHNQMEQFHEKSKIDMGQLSKQCQEYYIKIICEWQEWFQFNYQLNTDDRIQITQDIITQLSQKYVEQIITPESDQPKIQQSPRKNMHNNPIVVKYPKRQFDKVSTDLCAKLFSEILYQIHQNSLDGLVSKDDLIYMRIRNCNCLSIPIKFHKIMQYIQQLIDQDIQIGVIDTKVFKRDNYPNSMVGVYAINKNGTTNIESKIVNNDIVLEPGAQLSVTYNSKSSVVKFYYNQKEAYVRLQKENAGSFQFFMSVFNLVVQLK